MKLFLKLLNLFRKGAKSFEYKGPLVLQVRCSEIEKEIIDHINALRIEKSYLTLLPEEHLCKLAQRKPKALYKYSYKDHKDLLNQNIQLKAIISSKVVVKEQYSLGDLIVNDVLENMEEALSPIYYPNLMYIGVGVLSETCPKTGKDKLNYHIILGTDN